MAPHWVEGIRVLLKKGTAVASVAAFLDVVRSPPHGHIDAPIGSLRKIALHAPAISFTMIPMGRSGSRRPMLTIVCPPYTLT